MNNYKLTIQYDGARYKGWQRLGNGEKTIQGKIESVLSEMVGQEIQIVGCSRTDAGVHALQQVANFKTKHQFQELDIKIYLNHYLPQDISIQQVESVFEKFHARYHAIDKTYLYKIWNKNESNPFIRKYSMHVKPELDVIKMTKAANYFIGKHDFTAFSNAKSKKKSMVRSIYSINIEKHNGLIEIRVEGDGFLHNMVRKMVGMLIDVGLGQMRANEIPNILAEKKRNKVSCLADSCGLYLEYIKY